ncbi:MAG: hypothetical protein ABIR59_05195 [Gemmatimonadales bacterium]
MRITILMPLVAAAMLVACKGSDAKPAALEGPPLEEVLPNIPFPPNAEPVASERADKALKLVFASSSPSDSVVAYYRTVLAAAPYRLINEGMSGNITSFYVEQDGPSMWVTVQPVDINNSMVTIAGAQGDPNRKPDPAIPDPVGAQGQPLPPRTSVPSPDDPQRKPQD